MRFDKTSEHIAFVCKEDADGAGNRLYTIRPDGSHLRLISADKSKIHYHLDWSPDGEWLAFILLHPLSEAAEYEWDPATSYHEIHRIRYNGTEARRLTYNSSDESQPQWTGDGGHILFHERWFGSWQLHRVDRQANHIEALTTFEIGGFNLSPDGQRVVALARNRDGGPQLVYLLKPDGSDVEILMTVNKYISNMEWSPDNQAIMYYAHNGRLHIYNISAGNEEPVPLVRVSRALWSPDGRWIVIIGGRDRYRENGEWIDIPGAAADEHRSNLYLLDRNTGELQQPFDASTAKTTSVSWSPDSQWLAFSLDSPSAQVYKARVDGSGIQQLTELDCRAYGVLWSPN